MILKNLRRGAKKEATGMTEPSEKTDAVKPIEAPSFASRLRRLLGRTSASFSELAEQLEEEMLLADFGVPTTKKIIRQWRSRAGALQNKEQALEELRTICARLLAPIEKKLVIGPQRPFCVLMMGTNGVGKTTSLAKIAYYYKKQGLNLSVVAGDTCRAAAIEQLREWGSRLGVPVSYGKHKSDSAAVIYEGMQTARNKKLDLVLIDTSGIMISADKGHNEKIVRALKKIDPSAPHESLLVLDASHGQNALMQARGFCAATQVDGFCLTKLDGSAKGGMVFALTAELGLPLRFIGTGEKLADLNEFDKELYLSSLFESAKH